MEKQSTEAQHAVNQQSQYLRIKLGNQIILIGLDQIHIVLPIQELQTIPHHDPALAGLLNYHGKAVPVYHFSELIKVPTPEYDLDTPLLVCNLSSDFAGFLVSEVIDIMESSSIEPANPTNTMPYVIGLLENEAWSAWVVDLERLLSCHQSQLDKSHA